MRTLHRYRHGDGFSAELVESGDGYDLEVTYPRPQLSERERAALLEVLRWGLSMVRELEAGCSVDEAARRLKAF